MIDTICLLIPKNKMLFTGGSSKWELYSKTGQNKKFICNPSNKLEKETGKYFPRLTQYEKGFFKEANVKIEFSAPKLLYLNNLDELENKDFLEVVATLKERLKDMGVLISKSTIQNASVCSVHFSKNILLKDGYTSSYLISEIGKIDLRKSFDFAKTKFVNDGQSLYAHAISHQFVIYDKIADLSKSTKKAVDKDQTLYQRSLSSKLYEEAKKEIIRFEIRLNHKVKLNKVLYQLGYAKNPTFKDIFNLEMSKKVVNDYWKKIIKDKNLGIFSIALSVKDTLQAILFADQKIKPKQAIYLLGLSLVAKDGGGMRQLRAMISKRSLDRTWYRITRDKQYVDKLIAEDKVRNWVKQIDKSLADYKPYKKLKNEK